MLPIFIQNAAHFVITIFFVLVFLIKKVRDPDFEMSAYLVCRLIIKVKLARRATQLLITSHVLPVELCEKIDTPMLVSVRCFFMFELLIDF